MSFSQRAEGSKFRQIAYIENPLKDIERVSPMSKLNKIKRNVKKTK